ncbi:flagellar hook-basal body complex protein FliE [bacterium]|jgi:flagellar hook-basal body complex protein FliE|nr:flagellar hook-basal body complex protein FliE [Armatimonadetes bacterium Uphvl-Ar1]MBA4293691.1 flagellar hook-basal body complex protein FliE [bacterium]
MKINVNSNPLANLAQPPSTKQTEQSEDFGQMLMDVIKEVNGAQGDARKLQEDLMANRPVETHELMIAMERASTAMQLTMQVRNKALEAYQEITRMQV